MIVVDASVLADALFDVDDQGAAARDLLARDVLAAPAHIDAEVLSVARKRVAAGSLDARVARAAVNVLGRMQLRRVVLDGLLSRMWELKDNMTPYDGAYGALAEVLQVPLVTADRRLARSPGLRCEVRLHT